MLALGVPFDVAVGYYGQTRALPEDVMVEMTRMLTSRLQERGRCLEIAVGTGRMAIPLDEAGVAMYGVDLSLPMLVELQAKSSLPIAQASATRLPFPANFFGSAIACLALHVIPDWQAAVDEVKRVVVPGGVFLVQPPWSWSVPVAGEVRRYFAQQVGLAKPVPGVLDMAELDQYCAEQGMWATELPTFYFTTSHRTIGETLEQLEKRQNSWTWNIPPEDMARGITQTAEWARERFGSLTEPREMIAPLTWRAYVMPA